MINSTRLGRGTEAISCSSASLASVPVRCLYPTLIRSGIEAVFGRRAAVPRFGIDSLRKLRQLVLSAAPELAAARRAEEEEFVFAQLFFESSVRPAVLHFLTQPFAGGFLVSPSSASALRFLSSRLPRKHRFVSLYFQTLTRSDAPWRLFPAAEPVCSDPRGYL